MDREERLSCRRELYRLRRESETTEEKEERLVRLRGLQETQTCCSNGTTKRNKRKNTNGLLSIAKLAIEYFMELFFLFVCTGETAPAKTPYMVADEDGAINCNTSISFFVPF